VTRGEHLDVVQMTAVNAVENNFMNSMGVDIPDEFYDADPDAHFAIAAGTDGYGQEMAEIIKEIIHDEMKKAADDPVGYGLDATPIVGAGREIDRQVDAVKAGKQTKAGTAVGIGIALGLEIPGAKGTVKFTKATMAKIAQRVEARVATALKGEYRHVKGHHVHAKKAFEGDLKYDAKKGFSISEDLMRSLDIEHARITGAQKRLFAELEKSGRPNTIYEHSRIAVESMVQAGMPLQQARDLVAESLKNLRSMGVKHPTNIPWGKK
jgi:hypothetical protein